MEVITNVLIRLDTEARAVEHDLNEYARRGHAIKFILENVKNDFGVEAMSNVVLQTSRMLGHTLNPLDSTILKDLINRRFVITKIQKAISCKR